VIRGGGERKKERTQFQVKCELGVFV